MIGSLLAAFGLVLLVVLLVAWRIGSDGVRSEAREERLEEEDEREEEAAEAREEALEREEERGRDDSGRGRSGDGDDSRRSERERD